MRLSFLRSASSSGTPESSLLLSSCKQRNRPRESDYWRFRPGHRMFAHEEQMQGITELSEPSPATANSFVEFSPPAASSAMAASGDCSRNMTKETLLDSDFEAACLVQVHQHGKSHRFTSNIIYLENWVSDTPSCFF